MQLQQIIGICAVDCGDNNRKKLFLSRPANFFHPPGRAALLAGIQQLAHVTPVHAVECNRSVAHDGGSVPSVSVRKSVNCFWLISPEVNATPGG